LKNSEPVGLVERSERISSLGMVWLPSKLGTQPTP
jgi:hypothetical protein